VRLFFNTIDIIGRVQAGDLTETTIRDSTIPPEKCTEYGFSYGTRSQFVLYRDGADEVARAHRYLLPDGKIGGSGLPDPKRIICCGVILFC
jgi:hypothetical protein